MDAESRGLRLEAHSDLGGFGDGMQVLATPEAVYVGHFGPSGAGTTVLTPDLEISTQWMAPSGLHTHKVQVADGLLLVNHEHFRSTETGRGGMAVYRLDDPLRPEQIGWLPVSGKGVHRIVWTGGHLAYVSMTPEGFRDRIWAVVDLTDPGEPVEVSRWWWPGQHVAAGERPTWPEGQRAAAHHGLVEGDRAYVGWGDLGVVILDVADPTQPMLVSQLGWSPGSDTHTCLPLPGRSLLAVTDEMTKDGCTGEAHLIRIVDISEETRPRVVGICPEPVGDYCTRGLRFGPHNLHENRPGSYRSAELIFATYFNAGVRVYDTVDARHPREVAHWVPVGLADQGAAQINDLFVATDHRIYLTDRVAGGLFVLRPEEELADRMRTAAL